MQVKYNVFMSVSGWTGWVFDGAVAGNPAGNERIEAFQVELVNAPAGVSLVYQARLQGIGWQGQAHSAGRVVGSPVLDAGVDGLWVQLVDIGDNVSHSIRYNAHLPFLGGWLGEVRDGSVIGRVRQDMRAMTIRLV
jgi:internalin A